MTKKLCIYHADCNDGTGAALAVHLAVGEDVEYLPMHYGTLFDPERCRDKDVFVLDFSFVPPVMQAIGRVAASLVWLDHHKTAAQNWHVDPEQRYEVISETDSGGPVHMIYDPAKSGAVLAFEHFFPKATVPLFAQYIQDRDLWQWALPDSREFSAALSSYPRDMETWQDLLTAIEGNPFEFDAFISEGDAILRAQAMRVKTLASKSREIYVQSGERTLCGRSVNATSDVSEVGEAILAAGPEADFALVWFVIEAEGKAVCSLRSRNGGNIDVAELARGYGGGGHKHAAGFTMTLSKFLGTGAWLRPEGQA